MSGHSKWDTIKHKKAINDAKKGKEFSKLSVQITHAARQGGGDPGMNPNLRLYIDKARDASFPMDRIEKAIEKGVGGADSGIVFEEASYEGFGPGGIQLIVDTISDNKNRTVSELRQIFDQVGGNIGAAGSVSWNFETKGYVVVKSGHMEKAEKFGAEDTFVADDSDDVMMMLMDIPGILDIEEIDMDGVKGFEIYTEYNQLAQVRDSISKLGFVLKEAEIVKEPKIYKKLEGEELEKAQNAIERLEEYEDVQNVWTDLDY
ncbi:YebC/PmpR family DNA-binding transcriptional regulator [Patescibacteria group bacterium]|nr:YebC/PmpR family DNA-binding transcriptional regulator [Patescibacteria group bacterium]